MIDNILMRSPQFISGAHDMNRNGIIAYPNPTSSGILHLDYPHNYVTGIIEVFNTHGQRVKQLRLAETISIADLPKGLYHYRVTFGDTRQQFTGAVLYE